MLHYDGVLMVYYDGAAPYLDPNHTAIISLLESKEPPTMIDHDRPTAAQLGCAAYSTYPALTESPIMRTLGMVLLTSAGPGAQQHPPGKVPPPAQPVVLAEWGGAQPYPPGTRYGSGLLPTQHVSPAGHVVQPFAPQTFRGE